MQTRSVDDALELGDDAAAAAAMRCALSLLPTILPRR